MECDLIIWEFFGANWTNHLKFERKLVHVSSKWKKDYWCKRQLKRFWILVMALPCTCSPQPITHQRTAGLQNGILSKLLIYFYFHFNFGKTNFLSPLHKSRRRRVFPCKSLCVLQAYAKASPLYTGSMSSLAFWKNAVSQKAEERCLKSPGVVRCKTWLCPLLTQLAELWQNTPLLLVQWQSAFVDHCHLYLEKEREKNALKLCVLLKKKK